MNNNKLEFIINNNINEKGILSKILDAIDNTKKDYSFVPIPNFHERKKNDTHNKFISRIDPKLNDLIYDNPFIMDQVKPFIENNNLVHKKIIYNGVTIYLWYKGTHKMEDSLISNLLHICHFMMKLSNKNVPIEIRIIYTDFKKKFPPKNQITKPENVNTGSTIPYQFINLWRSEEIEKVLIHELVHYLELDVSNDDNHKLKKYYDIFDFEGFDSPRETYTELLAVIINCCYCSLSVCSSVNSSINAQTVSDYQLYKLIENEIQFSLFQIAKIMDHFDIQSISNIQKSNNGNNENKVIQSTSVFSYYIIKGIILFNFESLLEFVNTYFNKFNVDAYIILLEQSLYNNKLNNEINNKLNNGINKHLTNVKNNLIDSNSMRMTLSQK